MLLPPHAVIQSSSAFDTVSVTNGSENLQVVPPAAVFEDAQEEQTEKDVKAAE